MLLEKLSNARAVSGREKEVRELLREEIKDNVDRLKTDVMGNLIAVKGPDKPGPRVMLAAHMDEVGLMISEITTDGLLKFKPVGGFDKRILVSKKVSIGEKNISGVIGAKAIHLQKKSERDKPLDYDNLYIDIGAKNKENAEKLVSPGDMAAFTTEFKKISSHRALGKAFDDRVGCSLLAELTEYSYDYPIYFVFTVQEEVGLRGAGQAAYWLKPDLALVLEGTSAADVPENKEFRYSTTLGKGPALTVRDRTIVVNKKLLQELIATAEEHDIPYQFRRTTAGGNDAGVINITGEGIPAAVISLPCRYIHSPVSLLDLTDYANMKKLVYNYLLAIKRKEF